MAGSSQIINKKSTEDAIVEEAYHTLNNVSNMPRVNTLAKVRIKVRGQQTNPKHTMTNESYQNETSINAHSTSYGGGIGSPRQTSGKVSISY